MPLVPRRKEMEEWEGKRRRRPPREGDHLSQQERPKHSHSPSQPPPEGVPARAHLKCGRVFWLETTQHE